MHVGVVSTEFPPSLGGVETYAWEYSKELVRRGHEVTVFTAPQADGLAELPGARVLPLLRRRRKHDRNVLRQHRVDVWHVMNAGYAWLALDLPEPVIASVHGNDFLRPYVLAARLDLFNHWRPLRSFFEPLDIKLGIYRSARLMRKAFRKVRHILANSHFTERVFLEHFPDCQGKTSTAWVGVANEFFSIEHIPGQGDAPRLLTISRLSEPRKNVALVLHALSALKGRYPFSYTVVGDGLERMALENLAHSLDLADRVRFCGSVDNGELRQHLAQCDLFVLTASINAYSHEGFGIVYLEANAAGVPVLAARLAGAAEAVAENVSGYFVEEPSVADIAAALEAFLAGRRQFQAAACRDFARQFHWARVVEQAEKYYDVR